MMKKFITLTLLLPLVIVGCAKHLDDSSSGKPSVVTSSTPSSENISSSAEESSYYSSSISTSSDSSIHVTSVSLNRESFEMYIDGSASLTATVSPSNATNKNVTWSSTNTDVATVSNGTITPCGLGTTTVKVKTQDGNKTASCSVTVKQKTVVIHGAFNGSSTWTDKAMDVNLPLKTQYVINNVSLYANDKFKVHMQDNYWYGYSAIKDPTSDVISDGTYDDNIKVLTTGVYNIYCDYVASGGKHITIERDVVHVTGITLNASEKYMIVGDNSYLIETISPANATNQNVTWTSNHSDVASVNQLGKVDALAYGKTVITATTSDGGKTAQCTVYVRNTTPYFYLYGTINGQEVSIGNYQYSTYYYDSTYYIIPNVELKAGDVLHIYNTSTNRPMEVTSGNPYTLNIPGDRNVDIKLNPLNAVKNYLTLVDK